MMLRLERTLLRFLGFEKRRKERARATESTRADERSERTTSALAVKTSSWRCGGRLNAPRKSGCISDGRVEDEWRRLNLRRAVALSLSLP